MADANKRFTYTLNKRPTTIRDWLETEMGQSDISGAQIARDLGVPRNSLSAWKSGQACVPVKHIAKLVKIFNADPVYIYQLAITDYLDFDQEAWEQFDQVRQLGKVTANEAEFLKILREAPVANPKMNEEQKEEFRKFVSTLRGDNGLSANSPNTITRSRNSFYDVQETLDIKDRIKKAQEELEKAKSELEKNRG